MSAAGPGRPAPRHALPARPLQIKPQEPGHNQPAQPGQYNYGRTFNEIFIILLVTNGVGVWQGPPNLTCLT